MAKSLRSSRTKSNNVKLRAKVFGPIEAARTARLSQKLAELSHRPRAERTEMDVDTDKGMADRTEPDATKATANSPPAGTGKGSSSNSEGQSAALDSHNLPIPREQFARNGLGAGEDEGSDSGRSSVMSDCSSASESESEDDELRRVALRRPAADLGASLDELYAALGLYSPDIDLIDDDFVFSRMF